MRSSRASRDFVSGSLGQDTSRLVKKAHLRRWRPRPHASMKSRSSSSRLPVLGFTATRCWRPAVRVRGLGASNLLLSVRPTPGSAPHPVFAGCSAATASRPGGTAPSSQRRSRGGDPRATTSDYPPALSYPVVSRTLRWLSRGGRWRPLRRHRLQAGAVGNDPVRQEAPQRDEQFAGEGDNAHFTRAGPGAAEPRVIPASQLAVRLVA
jgi:hypothetical protein